MAPRVRIPVMIMLPRLLTRLEGFGPEGRVNARLTIFHHLISSSLRFRTRQRTHQEAV
jgi:hypothetical protein